MHPPGTTLGGYQIEGLLGRGGMGIVYEATQRSLHRRVALKILSAELGSDPALRARFQREGRLHAALDHPHIVPVYDFGELEDESLFIAMRLVPGSNLKQLTSSGRLEPERALRVLGQVADAIDSAHGAGLVHRDIKPQNILVGPRDHAYLADFGLTRADGDTAFTRSGQFVGTLDYIAPEQIRGLDPGPAADVYSFAAVAYECLTRSVPFPRSTEAAVLFAHVSDDAPPASELEPGLAALDAILARGLAKDPQARPPTALAFVGELLAALTETRPAEPSSAPGAGGSAFTHPRPELPTSGARVPPPEPQVPTRTTLVPARPRRRPGAALSLGLVAVALAAGAGGALAGGGRHDETPSTSPGAQFRAGAIAMRAPAGWRASAAGSSLPGLELEGMRAFAVTAGAPPSLVAGSSAGSGPTLLPRSLTTRLGDTPSARPVRMGSLEALRYDALRPRGAPQPITLLVAPTTGGVATVACVGAASDRALCEAAAATATPAVGIEAHPLAPRAGYARDAARVLGRLAGDRRAARRQWATRTTRAGQARAAGVLAERYARAARSFAALPDGPRERAVQDRVVERLRAVGSALRTMRDAARAGREASYARARTDVRRLERALGRALDALRTLGYRVR